MNFIAPRKTITNRLVVYRLWLILSSIRRALWRQLDPTAYEHEGLSPTNKAVVLTVIVASLAAIVETEPEIESLWPELFDYIEAVFTILFGIEYCARVWAAGENPHFSGIRGRCRYALMPASLLDLFSFLPGLLVPAFPNLFLLRVFRLIRILRLARLGRLSLAVHHSYTPFGNDGKSSFSASCWLLSF